MRSAVLLLMALLLTSVLSACGGGGGGDSAGTPVVQALRANITHAATDDNPLTLSWPTVTDASSYRVHYSTSSGVTTSDPYLETTSTSLTLSATAGNLAILDGERYDFLVVPIIGGVAGTPFDQISVAAQPKWSFISPGHGVHAGISGYTEAMAYDSTDGVYLHVGDNGLIARSTDGINWSVQHTGADGYHFNAAVWTGSRFVVLGTDDGYSQGIVLTSADGIDWTFTPGLVDPDMLALAWDGANLLAVGSGVAAYSSDQGNSWTAITDMSGTDVATASFTDVIWDGSRFVISGSENFVTTSDLANWTTTNQTAFTYVNGLDWDGSTYVAATSTGLYTSTDLTTWVSSGLSDSFRDVVWDAVNNQFLALAVGGGSASVYTSPDGTTWTERLAGESKNAWALFSADGTSFFLGGMGKFLSSSDGITWSPGDAVDAANLTGLTPVGANGWAAVGNDAIIGLSADGDTWSWSTRTCSTWTTGTGWSGIVHNGSQYVVVGNEGCVMTSPDGATWTEQNSGVGDNLSDVVWDGSQFVAVGATGTLLTSPDGVTWTTRSVPTTQSLIRLIHGGSTYVAIGNAGTIITSTDTVNWTARTSGTSNNLRSLAYDNGQYLVGAMGNVVLTSSDAITWSKTNVGSATLRSVGITAAGYFVFADDGAWYTSSDGSSWTQQPLLPRGAAWRFAVNANGRMMVSGIGGLLMAQ